MHLHFGDKSQYYLRAYPMYVEADVIYKMAFMYFDDNPFMPKPIADELDKLKPKIRFISKTEMKGNYLLVERAQKIEEKTKTEEEKIYIIAKSAVYVTLGTYFLQIIAIKKAIIDWLK